MDDKEENSEKKDTYIWWIGGIFALAVFILWLATPYLISLVIPSSEDVSAARGQFGDMYGSINALFSGWAFVGVIVAILLQKQELMLQREELEKTREEFETQNTTLSQQRFENTFFNMLSLHNEIVTGLKVSRMHTSDGDDSTSRKIFPSILYFCQNQYNRNIREDSIEKIEQVVSEAFNAEFSEVLGQYFRNLYRIFVLIENSPVEDKSFYSKIVRAQLSDSELVILYYNCYYNVYGKNFQKYAEKFELFDNLPQKKMFHPLHKVPVIIKKMNP